MTSANLTALAVALLAACAALWFNYDALYSLRSPRQPSASSNEAHETQEKLDFDSLREYSAANANGALRWGTYRSGLYHGIRSRTYPYSLSAGLLWGSTHEDVSQLRHECRQEDRLQKYGWLQHDGRRYGWQNIEDQFNRVKLDTYYVRLEEQGGWASRFSVSPLEPKDERLRKKKVDSTKLSLYFYVDLGCGDESLSDGCRRKLHNLVDISSEPTEGACAGDEMATCAIVSFESQGVQASQRDNVNGPFEFRLMAQLRTKGDAVRAVDLRYAGLKDANVVNVKERLVSLATRSSPQDDEEIALDNTIEDESTLLVIQATVDFDASVGAVNQGDIELDATFFEGSGSPLEPKEVGELVDRTIPQYRSEFERRFEKTFQLESLKGYDANQVAFAQAAFSNLIGGTSFFYGSSLVQHNPEDPSAIEEMPAKPLFTAVPSRSFFPRGFLWDEGFHQLGISHFDSQITRDVLAHWLGVMEEDGYIAREQILGQSARRRVPSEFLVQHVEHANPPTLLLLLEKMLESWDVETEEFFRLIFPFLDRWYSWFVTTQRGAIFEDKVATLRWRGRHSNDGKLIANTLSSGLDDYPRSSTVSDSEMHVDLLSWMIKSSEILASIGAKLRIDETKLQQLHRNKERFETALHTVHWSEDHQSFFDVGEHNEEGHIEEQVVIRCRNEETGQTADTTASYEQLERRQVPCPASHPNFLFPLGDGRGGLKMQPVFVPESPTRLQHVRHVGYVSIFPLLLQVLPADSTKLLAVLEQIASPEHLWSPFGLRSLSTLDLFYEQQNAEGDNPYWRGSIWININYLALKALHHYANVSGPYQARAQEIYSSLRDNVVATIYGEYERTGYLWEQYSGNIYAEQQYGRGQRCHPFSGWTALVVNIMAEKY